MGRIYRKYAPTATTTAVAVPMEAVTWGIAPDPDSADPDRAAMAPPEEPDRNVDDDESDDEVPELLCAVDESEAELSEPEAESLASEPAETEAELLVEPVVDALELVEVDDEPAALALVEEEALDVVEAAVEAVEALDDATADDALAAEDDVPAAVTLATAKATTARTWKTFMLEDRGLGCTVQQ
ncbi:hypothetical protein BBJ28_00003890 [Nothophytophthora sp. Chile5]|nr:hypothetical protein BBJ28_00003890 [Nothophytophthora sp. Chile5]